MSKEELIQKETDKLNNLIELALEKHHIREGWVESNYEYHTAGKAIPDGIIEFTKIYLENLNKIINNFKNE
jgi:hypothetical protein